MKVPIPSDWDNETWECFQIQWPKSDHWRGILLGLISYPMRGRFWDERSGVIRDVQDVAWDIWAKDSPLLPCVICDDCGDGGDSSPQPGVTQVAGNSGPLDESEDDMTGVSWLSIEDGVLYMHFGPCCKVAVGGLADLQEGSDVGLPDDMFEPPGATPPTYSGCGKAYSVLSVVNSIVEAAFSAMGELPWSWVKYVQNAVGYDLDNNWLGLLLGNVRAGSLAGDSWENVHDAIEDQRILVKLEAYFADDAIGVPTSAAFEDIKGIFKSEIYPDSRWQYYDQAINALGRSDMDSAAKLGSVDLTRECSAYELEIPGSYTWSLYYDFRDGLFDWTDANAYWQTGLGFVKDPLVRYNAIGSINRAAASGTGVLTYAAIHVTQWGTAARIGAGGSPHWFQFNNSGGVWFPAPYTNGDEWVEVPLSQPYGAGNNFRFMTIQYTDDPTSGRSQWDGLILAGTGVAPWADVGSWTGHR